MDCEVFVEAKSREEALEVFKKMQKEGSVEYLFY